MALAQVAAVRPLLNSFALPPADHACFNSAHITSKIHASPSMQHAEIASHPCCITPMSWHRTEPCAHAWTADQASFSSAHVTFNSEQEWQALAGVGFMQRTGIQVGRKARVPARRSAHPSQATRTCCSAAPLHDATGIGCMHRAADAAVHRCATS